jgi:hypothetical protein
LDFFVSTLNWRRKGVAKAVKKAKVKTKTKWVSVARAATNSNNNFMRE